MLVRSVAFACAAALIGAVTPASAQTAPRCSDVSLRIYFNGESSALNAEALRALQIAESNIADCEYAELRVRVSGSHAYARGQAVLAAADGRVWDVARVEQRVATQRVSVGGPPAYAEVVMSASRLPVGEPVVAEPDAGV